MSRPQGVATGPLSKAILEAEEQKMSAVLASEGQADTFSFVSKFFKQ